MAYGDESERQIFGVKACNFEETDMADIDNAPANTPGSVIKCVSWCEENLPLIVLGMLVLFIIVSSISAYHLAVISEDHGERDGAYAIWPFVVFVALALAYSAWFISCFTGDPSGEKKRQSFRFAYAFTITAFVVLMIPVANPWQPDVIGPISLVRGCVLAPASDESSVPSAIRCARAEMDFLPPEVRSSYRQANSAQPASAGAVAASEAPASAPDEAAGKTDVPVQQYENCDSAKVSSRPCIEGHSYPWLVTLGGFNGVIIQENRLLAGQKKARASVPASSTKTSAQPASSVSDASLSSAISGAEGPRSFALRGSIVQGGFVVPFYVVLLALVGGAVSLARRIPEYQKRSVEGYLPTLKQPALNDIEVREVVVFQIMQLISAPFIAVVAFYTIAPNTMSSAIGLAFLSGFASELILLQVRGVIEGLQPHSTSSTNPVNKPESSLTGNNADPSEQTPAPVTKGGDSQQDDATVEGASATGATVSGTIVDPAGKPISGAMVQVVNSTVSAVSDNDGRFSLANAPSGEQHMAIKKGDQQTSQDVTVANTAMDVGSITLGAGGAG